MGRPKIEKKSLTVLKVELVDSIAFRLHGPVKNKLIKTEFNLTLFDDFLHVIELDDPEKVVHLVPMARVKYIDVTES